MALLPAVSLVHKIGAAALQLKAAYVQYIPLNESRQHELAYLLSGVRELSVAIHSALLEGFQTSNESLCKAVCSTLQRVLHSTEELRNHEYRCLALTHGSPNSATAAAAAAAACHSSSFGRCSSHLRNCCAQLSQAGQELASYVHLSVSMASCALASGGQACRSQMPLPEAVTSELSLLHRIASSLELSTTAAAATSAVDQQQQQQQQHQQWTSTTCQKPCGGSRALSPGAPQSRWRRL
uniref:Uncharacterized protein n=1 Tax=Tetradesmus obliquus TaxID=3088 RepID=A0A383WA28_TETOB|eukprot:jgi/Sobl393_1/16872/SZX74093.1